MNNTNIYQDKLDYFESINSAPLKIDLVHIEKAYADQRNDQSLAIKILSIVGAVMACLAFLVFLYATNLFESKEGLLIGGIVLLIGSLVLNKLTDRIFFDSISVCMFLLAYIMLGISTDQLGLSFSSIALLIAVLAISCVFITRSYILNFAAVLIAVWGIYASMVDRIPEDYLFILIIPLGLLSVFFLLNEAKLLHLSEGMAARYLPLRTALTLAFIGSLVATAAGSLFFTDITFKIVCSGIFIVLTIVILFNLLKNQAYRSDSFRYLTLAIIAISLSLTSVSPAISGCLLIGLICFQVNYKTGYILALAGFLYCLGQFYYDLSISLLWKSVIMMASGALYLLIYLLNNKKLKNHENI